MMLYFLSHTLFVIFLMQDSLKVRYKCSIRIFIKETFRRSGDLSVQYRKPKFMEYILDHGQVLNMRRGLSDRYVYFVLKEPG